MLFIHILNEVSLISHSSLNRKDGMDEILNLIESVFEVFPIYSYYSLLLQSAH